MFTDALVRAAKPKKKEYKLAAGEGLYLLVRPSGRKFWKLKFRYAGKEQKLSLGAYPVVSLREARVAVKEAKSLIQMGINPSEQKRLDKYALRASEANSFRTISEEWIVTHIEDKSPSHRRRTLATLDRHLFPILGNRPFSEITAPELLAVLRKPESADLIDSAHRARQLFGQIARYAIATGRLEINVAADLKGALKSTSTRHYAAITNPADVGRLMLAIDTYRATPVVMAALRISPLLMVRPGEIRHMEWAEIDFQNSLWTIPAEKMQKSKKDHLVPLAKQSLTILKEIWPYTNRGKYVFPSARSRGRPLSENGIRVALRTIGYTNDEMTPHGFRAMARTLLDEELGFRVDYIEHQLAHRVKDATGRAYNRTQFVSQRQDMMQRWADYLDDLKERALCPPMIKEFSQKTNALTGGSRGS